MRDYFVKELLSAAKANQKIILLTGDLGFGLFDDFEKELPNQYFNVGISEQNMIGMAAGLSLDGNKVFCYSIGNFSFMRCLEQIRNDVCYHNLDVNIISSGPGFSYGSLGFTHHTIEDISIIRAIPNINILSPATRNETDEALKSMINFSNPSYCRLDKVDVEIDHSECVHEYEWGTLIGSENEDIIILTTGTLLREVLDVMKNLSRNHSTLVSVLSLNSIKDFNTSIFLDLIRNKKFIFTVEEHVLNGGLGSLIAELVVDESLNNIFVRRIGIANKFAKVVGDQDFLRHEFNLSSDKITQLISSELRNHRNDQ